MKEQFEDLRVEVIVLEEDVIATSGTECNQGGPNELPKMEV